jgi:hypothetical protein
MSLELEEEWSKQKAAKQEAGREMKPPQKSRKPLIVALVGVAVAGLLVAIVIAAGSESGPEPSTSSSGDKVRIEFRAMPPAEIRVDGKNVGKTPMSLQFPKSNQEIRVEATMIRHFVKRGGEKDETWVDRRTVTLDRDRLLDFKLSTAKLEQVDVSDPPEQKK